MKSGKTLFGVLAGMVAGAALGAWLVSDKRPKSQKKVSKLGNEFAEALGDRIEERLGDLIKSAVQKMGEQSRKEAEQK